MGAHCWLTWVLYQCATVMPDAFSFGEPLESGPKETKINAAATSATNHSQRFRLESFIATPLRLSHSLTRNPPPERGPILPLRLGLGRDPGRLADSQDRMGG